METKKLDILPILQIQLPSASNILTAMIFVKSVFGSGAMQMALFEVKTAWDGEVLATLEVQYTNVWGKVYRTGYDSGWNTGALPDLSR